MKGSPNPTLLADLRKQLGTQEEVAGLLGIERSRFGRIEIGVRNATPAEQETIAKCYGLLVSSLFDEAGKAKRNAALIAVNVARVSDASTTGSCESEPIGCGVPLQAFPDYQV